MSAQVATRMTCFALLSAVEEDIRAILKGLSINNNITNFLTEDIRTSATSRFIKDINIDDISRRISDQELLQYLDFADLGKAINTFKSILNKQNINITWLSDNLIKLAPARNRVCHSRPLEVEDLPQFLDFIKEIQRQYSSLPWKSTNYTTDKLSKEPTFVLYATIPEYWMAKRSRILHNLPIAEFDDTGFVGRREDRRIFDKHLRSSNPVISLLGEGGTGKTALALRGLYDLVDREDCPYDLIVWVSLKSRSLTSNGIQTITSAISNTSKFLEEVEIQMPTPSEEGEQSVRNRFSIIIEYMNAFRTILVIDNLETISALELRELYTSIPAGSKLIITSRVGLGEAEVRVPVSPMNLTDSLTLFKSFARFLNKIKLASLPDKTIERYCQRLHNNPLLIKWFLSSIADGKDPQNLLAPDSTNLDAAISFCFENLYSTLDQEQHEIINVLSCAGRPVADPELRFILQDRLKGDRLQWALNLLHRSSILRTETEQFGSNGDIVMRYSLTDIANQYISRIAKPNKETFSWVQQQLTRIRWAEQEEIVRRESHKYDPMNIHSASKYDHVATKDLRQALIHLLNEEYSQAYDFIERARGLHPSFSEVERVAAMIAADCGNIQKAEDHYKNAIDLNPRAGITLYSYSNFLLRSDRYEDGLIYIQKALDLDPFDWTLLTKKAIFFTRLGKYEEAAVLYFSILEHGPTFKKWRDTTLYHAYDNYKRWAEVYSDMQDSAQAREKMSLAYRLWEQLSPQESRTYRTKRLTWKLAGDTLYQLTSDAIEWSESAISWLEKASITITDSEEELRGLNIWKRKLTSPTDLVQRLEKVLASLQSPKNEFENSRAPIGKMKESNVSGIIEKYFPEKGFGFIKSSDGREIFFHKHDLLTRQSEHLLCHGLGVSFEMGINQKGPCAIKIYVLE